MTRLYHKIALLSFAMLISLGSFAKDKDKKEFRKEVEESFDIDRDAELEINTQFASVRIENWNQNKINVFAEIIIEAKSSDAAEEIFRNIDLDFSGGGSMVSINADLGGNNGKNSCDYNEGFEIKLVIQAPSSISLDADVAFGDLTIEQIEGKSDIHSSFGSIYAQSLSHDQNDVFVEFGEGRFESLSAKDVSVSFGDMTVDQLNSSANLNSSYGNLTIERMTKIDSDFEISCSFGDIGVGIDNGLSVEINSKSSFGETHFDSEFDLNKVSEGMFDKHYKAVLNGGKYEVDVENSYGNVDIEVI